MLITVLISITLISGLYMAWNIGANDVANAMGTSVGSKALSLKQAIVVAGILEFCGAFFFGSHVSETIEGGIINSDIFTHTPLVLALGMISSLISAGMWLQIASYFGWPVSTTHSIIGSIIGFGILVGGMNAVQWDNVIYIALSWVLSPLFGGIISYIAFTMILRKIFYVANPLRATKKAVPIILFIVMFTLTLSILYQDLDNLKLQLNLWSALGISMSIGALGGIVGYLSVRHIEPESYRGDTLPYNPKVINGLEKARRHLQNVQAITSGEMGSTVSQLVDVTQELSSSVREAAQRAESRSEFYVVEKLFAKLQLLSACLMAFSHGANDVANAIGPLAAAVSILQTGIINPGSSIPLWALALGGFGIVLGLATWGWRVIETIGRKLTELTPTRGFAAEFGAATTILVASRLGFPISATHTLVGAVLGVGFARGIEALNLATMRDIFISWVVTIPAGAGIAVCIFYALQSIFL
ncbi:MAG: inorganic phosphate transporter [Chlamydiales bacterium]